MFYTFYHIFKQESIQGRGTIKGRGIIKGRHLALYQIFKTTVFTTKYMINVYISLKLFFELIAKRKRKTTRNSSKSNRDIVETEKKYILLSNIRMTLTFMAW
jgi:hypothetical protein